MPVYISDNSFPKVILAPQTSFPVTPDTGTVVMRSDLDYETYFYDGTRWLSLTRHTLDFNGDAVTAANYYDGNGLDDSVDIWVERVEVWTYISGTTDGSNYYTISLRKYLKGNSTTALASSTTASDTSNVWTDHSSTVDTLVATSGAGDAFALRWQAAETGAAGTLYVKGTAFYRRVAT